MPSDFIDWMRWSVSATAEMNHFEKSKFLSLLAGARHAQTLSVMLAVFANMSFY